MKNTFKFILSILLLFICISCNQLYESETGAVKVSTDNIIKNIARTGEASNIDNVSLIITVKLSGAANVEDTRDLTYKDIGTEKTKFSFTNITIGVPLRIDVEVKSSNSYNTVVYSGTYSIPSVKGGDNKLTLNLNDESRFVLWNSQQVSDYSSAYNFRLYDGLNKNSIIGDKSNELKDFYFDNKNNLYTLESKTTPDSVEYFVYKYHYVAPEIPELLYTELVSSGGPGSVTYSCISAYGNDVYIGVHDTMASEPNLRQVKKIIGKNNLETAIPYSLLGSSRPSFIDFDDKGNLYVVCDGQYGPVSKFVKENGVFVEKASYEILGQNSENFKISDLQISGNYLYVVVYREMIPDSSDSALGFSGGVIPVEIKGDIFTSKPIVGFDKDGKYAVLDRENVSNEIFYHPIKFVSKENGRLYVADDGEYLLQKPGYTKAERNVNRVVTLSLNNPGAPVFESVIIPNGITFSEDITEDVFEFQNRYILWDDSNYVLLDKITDFNVASLQSPIPPDEHKGSDDGQLIDFHIDKKYGVYVLSKGLQDPSLPGSVQNLNIGIYSYKELYPKGSIQTDKDTYSCIASDGEFVYLADGTELVRYNISTKQKDVDFIVDLGASAYGDITALEFDDSGNCYIGVPDGGYNELRILKYEKGFTKSPVVCSLVSSFEPTLRVESLRGKISDLQVIGDKLYVLRRYVNYNVSNDIGRCSSGELTILNTNNLSEVVPSVGLKPNFKTETVPLNAPSSSTDFFYGPRKFIALKPDELVIADDGLFGSADEANSVVTYSLNGTFKNRTVLSHLDFGSKLSGSDYVE